MPAPAVPIGAPITPSTAIVASGRKLKILVSCALHADSGPPDPTSPSLHMRDGQDLLLVHSHRHLHIIRDGSLFFFIRGDELPQLLSLPLQEHRVHKVEMRTKESGESEEELVVSNLRPFTLKVGVHDANDVPILDCSLPLRATLLYENGATVKQVHCLTSSIGTIFLAVYPSKRRKCNT